MHNITFSNFLVILSYLFLAAMPKLRAAGFQVDGKLTTIPYDARGNILTRQDLQFRVIWHEGMWMITTYFDTNWYHIYSYNGTNVYTILYDPKGSKIPLPGFVLEDDYPCDASSHISVPWLAYCSANRINSGKTNNLPAPWTNPRFYPTAHLYTYAVEEKFQNSNLPAKLKYYTDFDMMVTANNHPYLYLEGVAQDHLRARRVLYHKIIKSGLLSGEYHVLESTNFNNFEIPLKFELKFYECLDHTAESGRRTFLRTLYTGMISNVSEATNTTFLPVIERTASVTDYRFKGITNRIDFITYRIADGKWITSTNEYLQKIFQEKLRSYKQPQRKLSKREFGLAFFAFVVAFPAIMWMTGIFRKKQ